MTRDATPRISRCESRCPTTAARLELARESPDGTWRFVDGCDRVALWVTIEYFRIFDVT
jgi:hypothetical protein